MQPAICLREVGHCNEKNSQDMSECKVCEEDLDKSPILFFIEVCDKEILYFLDLYQTLTDF